MKSNIKNINLVEFVSRVRHADAMLAQLAKHDNIDLRKELYKRMKSEAGDLLQDNDIPLYTIEVALSHLFVSVAFLKKQKFADEKLNEDICIVRDALAHIGETTKKGEFNIEIRTSGQVVFRHNTKNQKDGVIFENISKLAEFVGKINESLIGEITDWPR